MIFGGNPCFTGSLRSLLSWALCRVTSAKIFYRFCAAFLENTQQIRREKIEVQFKTAISNAALLVLGKGFSARQVG